jgi:hypothetical protein
MSLQPSALDTVEACLALDPLPYLSTSFSEFKAIWKWVQKAPASDEQLRFLSYHVAQLLQTLDKTCRDQATLEYQAPTSAQLDELLRHIFQIIHTLLELTSIVNEFLQVATRYCHICQGAIKSEIPGHTI